MFREVVPTRDSRQWLKRRTLYLDKATATMHAINTRRTYPSPKQAVQIYQHFCYAWAKTQCLQCLCASVLSAFCHLGTQKVQSRKMYVFRKEHKVRHQAGDQVKLNGVKKGLKTLTCTTGVRSWTAAIKSGFDRHKCQGLHIQSFSSCPTFRLLSVIGSHTRVAKCTRD